MNTLSKQNEVTKRSNEKSLWILSFLFAAAFLFLACSSNSDQSDSHAGHDHGPESKPAVMALDGTGPFKVVVTIGMLGDAVSEIMGDSGNITVLMGPGTDPHLYTPTRDDVVALKEADIIVYNGHHLEGRMTEQLESLSNRKPVIAAAELLPHDQLVIAQGEEVDPHIWTNVRMWSDVIETVAKQLSETVPELSEQYLDRGRAYQDRLTALHEYGIEIVATVPEDKRVLVSAHDAFEYFGREYGFEVLAIQGLSTEAEAGLGDIRELVGIIAERKIPAVFFESSVPKKSIDALVEGSQAKGHNVAIGGELFSDAMGPKGTYEGTYIGMMDHNLTSVVRALGGEAPELGLNSKLGGDK